MTVDTVNTVTKPPDRADSMPLLYFEPDLIVTPADNPPLKPAIVAYLVSSIREHNQGVPGWVCPSPDLPDMKRICLEGNHRLAACRMLGRPFWAFDLGRFVPEEDRIRITFQHNHSRRLMGLSEVAEKASRWMELTSGTQADASKFLHLSEATLSRAFGERRIPPELKPKAAQLGQSIRSLVAAMAPTLMEKAIDFALTPDLDGKRPTRDQVAAFISTSKKTGQSTNRKKTTTLRVGGRLVTLAIAADDTAASVAKDLTAIVAKLSKHAEVPPDGWPFLFH